MLTHDRVNNPSNRTRITSDQAVKKVRSFAHCACIDMQTAAAEDGGEPHARASSPRAEHAHVEAWRWQALSYD